MGLLEKGIISKDSNSIIHYIESIFEELNGRLSFGHPDTTATDSDNGRLLNIEGSWVVLTITAASGSVSCTHNLDVPALTVTVAAVTVYPANVRWQVHGIEYGDKTATNATPAAPAAMVFTLYRLVSEAMTADAITLRYLVTGVVPSATQPLTITLFFTKAVN